MLRPPAQTRDEARRKMISHFFIDRPIFAAVLSILITLTGAISLLFLPIAQYPPISPPGVSISISYPGASAQIVADTVAAPIEQQVNGVEGMLYMSSQMGNDGSYSLTVTFDIGTDLNTALVMVQNRVALAMPQLPTQVQLQGITIRKRTPDILSIVSFYSPDGRYDDLYMSNYATINVRDELFRVDGVSDINYLGERDYSIRAWLDPQKLAALNITAGEVAAAVRNQNLEAALGRVGDPPAPRGQTVQLPIDALGRLTDPEQYGNIVIKVGQSAPPPATAGAVAPGEGDNVIGGTLGTLSTGDGLSISGTMGNASASGGTTTGSAPASTTPQSSVVIPTTLTPSYVPSKTSGSPAVPSKTPARSSTQQSSSVQPSMSSLLSGGAMTSGGAMSTGGASTGSGALLSGPAHGGVRGSPPVSPGAAAPSIVRLRDVARVEVGALNYNLASTFDGRPTVGLGIHQLPGTNALDVAGRVSQKMEELKQRFPEGLDYEIAYDTTPFIRESVMDVVQTLLEAVVLVAVVVLLFLQSWRSTLIPLIAVPVAIVGTFAVMAALGFSLNNISLFGLVLAIGIVVDDAIVVVENVERWLEHGLPPREAARKAMDEVTGPVVAVALVLCAVFVPCAFISGITGQFFRQFAVTIAVSTVFSAFNSLTLSPALAAILLKPRGARRDPLAWLLDVTLGWFFRLFNAGFGAATRGYAWVVGGLLRASVIVLAAYAGLVVLTYSVFVSAPTGFVPQQDMGRLIVSIQLADSASLQRTKAVMAQVEAIALQTPGVAHTTTVSGMSMILSATASNFGNIFIILDPFEKRRQPELRADAIMSKLQREYNRQIKDAKISVLGAAPIPGVSVAGGFKLMVEDRGGLGLQALQNETDKLVAALQRDPRSRNLLTGVSTQFRSDTPQLFMNINRTKIASLGVPLTDVNQALQIYLGSLYANSYNLYGRYWQVTLQAEGAYRGRQSDINLLQVRNNQGQMVPLGTLVNVREIGGPIMVQRYNESISAPITGNLAPGVSSGDAIAAIEAVARDTLPRSMGTEWTELMFMQIRAGNTALLVFGLAVVFVFLALAALYESWSLPLAVILVVPLCLLCSVAGVLFTHNAVNIFVQIGLVVLVGLACKNAILIVEFAKQLRQEGKPRYEATREASQLRLRPILMTSLAFILGVVPLVIAVGAGAEMRRSLGTAVFSGMLGVTLFGIFLTPVFFYVIQGFGAMPVFATPRMQRAGFVLDVMLNILFLGIPYLLGRLFASAPRPSGGRPTVDTRIQGAEPHLPQDVDTRIQRDRGPP